MALDAALERMGRKPGGEPLTIDLACACRCARAAVRARAPWVRKRASATTNVIVSWRAGADISAEGATQVAEALRMNSTVNKLHLGGGLRTAAVRGGGIAGGRAGHVGVGVVRCAQ
jgi:hypothetical protein